MLYVDPFLNDWVFYPCYTEFFAMQYNIVEELRETINQKWTAEQSTAYIQFLDTLTSFLTNYVFTRLVHYYEDYFAWVEQFKQANQLGADLY